MAKKGNEKDTKASSPLRGHGRSGAALGEGPAYLFVQWDGGTITGCQIIGPDDPLEATFVVLYPHGIDDRLTRIVAELNASPDADPSASGEVFKRQAQLPIDLG